MHLAILIAIFSWLLGFFLPWWSVVFPGLIFGAWLGKKAGASFGYGFLGIGGLWLIQTLSTNYYNTGVLTSRMAELFNLPHSLLLILLTVLIGGLAGGFSTLTGYLFKETFLSEKDLAP